MNPSLPSWLHQPLLSLLAMRDSLPHALLITGARGIGKALLAEHFAAALLCEQGAGQGPACGACAACGWFQAGNHPDFRRVSPSEDEPASPDAGGQSSAPVAATAAGTGRSERVRHEIRIDQIRALADFIGVGAHRGGRKLVLIEPAEVMNQAAANALLKTLEEPPGDTCFLLVSGQALNLPATVRSRCVPFTVAQPMPELARAWLRDQLGEEAAQAERWLALADGAPLRARELAEPAAAAAHRLLLSAVEEIPDTEARSAEAFANLPASIWVPMLQAWVSDLARACAGATPIRFPAQARHVERLARRTRLSAVVTMASWLDRQARVLEHPLNQRLFAEDVWMRYQALFRPA